MKILAFTDTHSEIKLLNKALSKIKNQPEKYTGQGMAIAGIVLGSISTASLLVYFYYIIFNPAVISVQ